MSRFYLPPAECNGPSITLAGPEAHHALHVLRMRVGDHATILDGAGVELACEVASLGRDDLSLRVLAKQASPPPPAQLTLLQALPKGKLIESIVQKATELGAARIVPLLTERVVSRPDQRDAARRAEKLQAIAIESMKQCGTPWLPRVEPAVPLAECIARQEPFEMSAVASLQPGSLHPREIFHAFFQQHRRLPRSIALWIGPEGDFTPGEIADIQRAGALPITLGPLVLRSETAAVYCLSVFRYELQASPSSPFGIAPP